MFSSGEKNFPMHHYGHISVLQYSSVLKLVWQNECEGSFLNCHSIIGTGFHLLFSLGSITVQEKHDVKHFPVNRFKQL